MFSLFFHSGRVPHRVSVCDCFESSTLLRAISSTGNDKDAIVSLSALTQYR
jgi:hypothetical protein